MKRNENTTQYIDKLSQVLINRLNAETYSIRVCHLNETNSEGVPLFEIIFENNFSVEDLSINDIIALNELGFKIEDETRDIDYEDVTEDGSVLIKYMDILLVSYRGTLFL